MEFSTFGKVVFSDRQKLYVHNS